MSITIVDKIKDPSPFFKRIPHPTNFRTALEEQKYWAKQKKYWVEGYNEDINGMLYFYAQEVMLKDRVRGNFYYPTVRDADVLISQEMKKSIDFGEALFMLKGRGIGLSSWGMNLPFYFSRVNPNSKSIATSRDKKTLASLFTEKTMIAYEEMNLRIKPDLINKNQTASESYLKTGFKFINEDGVEKYSENEFLCRDTQESDKAATNFSGTGAIYGFADEAPLMPRLMKFFPSARECFLDHSTNKMVGFLLMGGTCEDTIKPEDVKRIADVWANASKLNIRPFFIPATYGKHMVNGHSNHEKAREEILKQRDELSQMDDKSQLIAYIKNNPLSIDEIFEFGKGGMFDEYAIEKINVQIRELPKVKQELRPVPHRITSIANSATVEPTDISPILILEHPKPDIEYIFGYDGISTSDLTSSENNNSKLASIVMKGVDPSSEMQFAPVATYLERPKSIEHGNIQVVNLFKYYNQYGKAKIMGEYNAGGEHAIQMFINEGLGKHILYRKDINKNGWVDTKKLWFYRADAILNWQIEAANIYFKKYSHMVYFKELLMDATKGKTENADLLDAFMAALYAYGTGDLLGQKTKEKTVKKIQLVKYEMEGGRLVPKWYEKELKV